jgi:integrase
LAGYIKKVTKDYFRIYVEAGKDPGTGKRKRVCKTFHGGYREAKMRLAELEVEVKQGVFLQPTGMTVAQYLRWWLEQHSAGRGLAPMTKQSYKFMIENLLATSIGAVKLEELTITHIQAGFVAPAVEKRLSPRTIEYGVKLLRTALKHAVKKYKLIKENPAEMVETPTNHKHKIRVLTSEEMSRLLDAAKDLKEYPIYLTALYTGMRRGEILGLRWKDVDLDKETAMVNQTIQRITGQGLLFKDCPKTESGFRIVDLPASVVNTLRLVKKKQAEHRLLLGPAYGSHNLVFCQVDGKPLDPDAISRAFHALVKQQGLNSFRFHDCRHTHASLLLADGEQLHVVQQRLGHRDATTTANIYGHCIPGDQRKAADRFDSKYGAPESGKKGSL